MYIIKYILICFLFPIYAFCQIELGKDLVMSSVFINFTKSDKFGSGILYSSQNGIYIITAKHIIERSPKDQENTVTVSYYSKLKLLGPRFLVKRQITADLKELEKKNLLILHPYHDIGVIKIANIRNGVIVFLDEYIWSQAKAPRYFSTFSDTSISLFDKVDVGKDVYIFGYPRSIGLKHKPQYDYDSPLVQKGIVSAINSNNSTFILNCPVFGGNSGSPVIIENIDVPQIGLAGIISEYIPYIDEKSGLEFNSGYSVVVPIGFALSLINKID